MSEEAYEELKSLSEHLFQFANERELTEILQQLTTTDTDFHKKFQDLVVATSAICSRVNQSKMTVAFVGYTSAGKSTTLNCLMRADRLKSSLRRTTFLPTSIESTPENDSFFKTESGRRGNLSDLRLNNLSNLLESNDALHIFLSPTDCQGTVLNQRLKLIDFPGWNDTNFDTKARQSLEDADVIVIVVDCVAGADIEEIRKLLRSLPTASKNSVFLVYNKFDILQKQSSKTKETLVEDTFKEAEKILFTDNVVFHSEAGAREATYMFSATDAFLMRNNDSMTDLEHALISDTDQGQVVICGESGAGKTSLCNQLLRSRFFPVRPNSGPGWTICHSPDKSSRTSVNKEALPCGHRLEDVLMRSKEALVTVQPANDLVKSESILRKCQQLVDAPSIESKYFEAHCHFLVEAISVVIVVSDVKSLEGIEEDISEILRCISSEEDDLKKREKVPGVFLVVNLWEKSEEKMYTIEQKESIRKMFSEVARDLQSKRRSFERVFFMRIKDFNEKEESAREFERFERRLLKSAGDQYVNLKIQNLCREASAKALEFQRLLSDDLTGWFEDVQNVCAILKEEKVEINEASSEGETLVSEFSMIEPDLPSTSEEKQAMVEKFYHFLCSSHSREEHANPGNDSVITHLVLLHFLEHSEAMKNFIRALCKQAEEKALQQFSVNEDSQMNEIRDDARYAYNSPEEFLKDAFEKISKGVKAAIPVAALLAYQLRRSVVGSIGCALAAVAPHAVRGAARSYYMRSWPYLTTREEVEQFLTIFYDFWFVKFVKFFNEELQKLALAKGAEMRNHKEKSQELIEEFVETFCGLETNVRQACDRHKSTI